eukprot:9166116-Alexandrium_andersonii.AAC.1
MRDVEITHLRREQLRVAGASCGASRTGSIGAGPPVAHGPTGENALALPMQPALQPALQLALQPAAACAATCKRNLP